MRKSQRYKVGKSENYRNYLLSTLQTMYDAGTHHFTLADMSEWSGLPVSASMRKFCDHLVMTGWLSVEPEQLREFPRPRTYQIFSSVWMQRTDEV